MNDRLLWSTKGVKIGTGIFLDFDDTAIKSLVGGNLASRFERPFVVILDTAKNALV
jgi:hypothetical protein